MYFNRKNAEQKNWRMIKKGKHFLFGCSLVFAIGAALVAPSVKADTVEANPEAGSTTEGIKPVVAEEDVTYAAPAVEVAPSTLAAPDTVVTEEKAEKPVATTENSKEEAVATTTVSVDKSQLEAVLAQAKAKSLEGQEASVKAEVAVAIAEAEALVANGSASQEKVNQSVERLTQAVASVKEVTEAVAETTKAAAEATTESSATPKVRNRRAVEGSVRSVDETNLQRAVVTKENFESFFQEGGTATYDKSTGTIKLTDDVSGQVGSAYLRFKINSGQPFTFTGKVDIGNKYEGKTDADGRPGGDGVGFVFHTGKVDTIGQSGASIGMGTIKNAFGFKLDSWHNTSNPNAAQNASADPKYSYRRINGKFEYEQNAFGAFYSSNAAGKVTTVGDAKALNPNPNGQWVDFKIEYDSKKNFTVTYGSQTWTTNLSKANTSIMTTDAKNALTRNNPTFALSFLGSTGSGTNLQRVQIERFEFTAPQIVHMKFVDVSGNEIEASSAIPGDENEVVNLSTQNKKIAAVEAKGYKLKRIDHSQARYYNEDNNTVTLKPGGQLLTYIFEEKDTKAPDAPKVNSVTAGATAVTGTAEAGSTVEVTLPDGTKKSAKADQDGNYSVPVSGLKEGDKVSVTATDDAGNKSTPTTVTVPDTTAPTTPKVNPVTAGATAVTGTAEAGSTVEVTLPNGSKASAKAGQDGNFSVPVSALKEGDTVSVTATDAAGNKSTPASVTVPDTTAPATPKVNPVTAGATAVTGTAEAGSTVEVTLPDGTKKSATADKDGNYSVPVSALKEGDTVSVTATDAAGNKSTPASVTVPDTTAPAAPKVNPVTAGATAVTGTAEAGSTVEVTLPDGTKKSATADKDGNYSVPVSALKEGDTVSVTATDAAGNKSGATSATVPDTTAPAAPKVNPVTAGATAVTGTAEAGSTVEVTLPDGTKKSAKADQDGNYSVPVSGLKEGDTVSVTATDAAGNKSGATSATVPDTTAPAAPKVNPVTAGATAVTGTAEAGSTVEVTLPDGTKKSATADKDGNYSVPVSALKEGDTVSVTATDAAGNKSGATEATVAKADDKTAPDAPKVNEVKAGDTAVTGTAEAGSTVEVTLPNGTKATATAGEDGTFSVPVSGLNEGDKVSVTATDAAGNKSGATEATVAKADDKTAPDAPKVNEVKAGDTAVTGTAEAGSTVEVTLPNGTKATATAGEDGTFSVPVSGLNEGDKVSVTATDAAGNKSGATEATVAKADDKTAPDAPKVNEVKAGDTAVTGTAEAGSTVEVTLPNGTKATATAGEDGTFSVPVSGLNEGDKVSVTATDAAGNKSGATEATVAKADDKTAPDAPKVNEVKAGDTAVTGTAEAGSTVEVTLPNGTKATATAGEDGTFSVPVSGLNEGDKVSVTATDAAGNKSGATEATVAKADDKTAPDAPKVNEVKAGDTAVTGTAEAGSTVEVTLPNGTKATATAGEDGTFSVPVSGLNEGDKVSVTATDAAGNKSGATEATVAKADDKTAPDAPKVNEVKAGATAVTGTAEAGSTVEVTLPNGTKATATAGEDGTFSVPVSGLNEGDKVSVTATDAAGNKSGATEATVAKADDKTAPDAPKVNEVKAGDTAVTGTAEAGSTVEVTLPNGTKATATAGEDGTFSVPVSDLEEGQTVSVTAKDASNNTSAPTTATVAKADDKTAPDAPKVNEVKAGDTAVTGTAEAGSTVEVTLPDGTKVSAKADKDGNYSVPVSGLKEGDKVSVTATDKAGNKSGATEATVAKADDKTAPTAPVVNPVKAGDTAVTGTAEAGSTVEVTLPDGTKASATADQDGNFSVSVSGLEEGQTVSVTAKDASNNTSTPTTATVAKADDKTAPAAPVVNPVKAGDTAVTGTAEAGSTVEVTLPDGTKASATADQDGNFSVPVSGLEEGQTVSVTAKDASNNTSTPTTATVAKADDKTAPAAPVVNPVKAGDTAVTGTAEAGSTVEVTLPDGTKASATADQDGNFSVPVSGLEEGQTVSVTAKDASNNTSTPTTATVAKADDKTAPAAPVVNPVKAGDTAVTGTAEAGSTVEVTLPDGTKASATADQDGNFSVPVSGLEEGQTVSVTAKDASNNTSTPTTATVAKADDKTAPAAPVVNPVKAGDTAVTGTAEAGSTVEVTLPDGTKASATADQDGNFSVPVSGLEEGQTVSVTAKDASNNTSTPTTATVAKADDKTAPAAPVVNPVKAGDTAVTGTAEAGSTVEVTLPDGTKASATADQDGNFSVPVSGLEEGQTVSVTAKDASNNTSTPTTATVAKADDKTAPAAPVVNPVKAGDTAVTGTAEAGSTVEVTLPDGTKASATADQDGNFSVPVSGLEEGQTVSVTAKDASNNTSTPTTATVAKADDKEAPAAPVVNPVKAGDTAVTGTAEAGSTVEVTLPDGTKASATADQDGNFSVPVSGLEEGQTVSVTAKDASNNTSAPTTATVAKADDKTAPDAPVVNPVKAGDTAVTGTAEAGSTVEVTLPDGTKVSAKADKDGNYSVPVSGLNAGDTVSVTATDESGNTSATTTVTVSNVNVGGKEADNAKVPALTPVVDPNNLTDAEKAKVAEEVKKANPTATDVKVNNDGSVVVTFADGSVATIAANKVVKEATKESSAQAPAKKAGAKELPNTGTKQSNASLGLALLAAVTGGLLVSKKRKEEE